MWLAHTVSDRFKGAVPALALNIEIFRSKQKYEKARRRIVLEIRVEHHHIVQQSHWLKFGDIAGAETGEFSDQPRIYTDHRAGITVDKNLTVCVMQCGTI